MKGLKDFAKLNLVLVFGVEVISNIAVAGLIGYFLDKWTFNNKVLFVIFLFLGVASGLYNGIKDLLKEAEKYEKLDKKDDSNDSGSNGD